MLLDVQHRLNLYKPARRSDGDNDGEDEPRQGDGEDSADRARTVGGLAMQGSSWVQPLRYIIAQAIFMALVVIVRRWWKGRIGHGKSL